MKKIFILIALPFLVIAGPAFGEADLVGTWQLESTCLEIGNNDDPLAAGVIDYSNETLVVVWQQQGLYKGYICGHETPNGIFFGTINNNSVTLTQWDANVEGKMQGNNKINLISQHALKNPPSAPATCNAVLTRISYDFECNPGPVIPWP